MAFKKGNRKGIILSLVILMMVYSMMTSAVFADESVNLTRNDVLMQSSGAGTWTGVSADCQSFSGKVEALKENSNTYNAQTERLTFTNNNADGKIATVVMDCYMTTSSGSVSIGGSNLTTASITATTQDAAQHQLINLAKGESFWIELNSGSGSSSRSTTVNILNFDIKLQSDISITLKKPVNGSYTVTSSDGKSATMTPDSNDTVFLVDSTATLTLKSSSPASGYKFDCWMDGNGNITSYKDGDTFQDVYGDNSIIVANFISTACNRVFTVGEHKYYSWEDAMDAAVSTGKPVVLNQASYTLPATEAEAVAVGEKLPNANKDNGVTHVELVNKGGTNYLRYIVPSGVTFGIPYNSTLSLEENNLNTTTAKVGKPAYTLTVKSGTELVVRSGATFVVNAMQTCSGTPTQGVTGGDYGKLVMGGTMTLEGGSKSYFRGYVMDTDHTSHSYGSGTGQIIVQNQAYAEVLFQIMTHRGGNATMTTVLYNYGKRIMPITNYYIGNIMMRAEVESGASISARYNFYIKGYYPGNVNLVAPSGTANTMFTMSPDARIIMDYDYATDRISVVAQKGTVRVENVKMSFTYALIGDSGITVPIDSKDVVMVLTDNMQVYAGEPGVQNSTDKAELVIANPIKMLPGAAIHVMENGTLTLPSENYLYAAADYDKTWSYGVYRSTLFISETYRNRTVGTTTADIINVTDDAAIYLAGTLNVDGTLLQSSQNAVEKNNRIIPISDTAVLNLNKLVTSGTVNELSNVDTDNFVTNTNWKVLDGVFVNNTELTDFEYTGTYKVVEQDSMYKWYNYKVTYAFQDEEGNALTGLLPEEQNPLYIVGDSTTLAASTLAGGKYVIKGYSIVDSTGTDITATAAVAAGENDPNAANAVSYGWENITFSSLTDDITVTLTVATYENRVNWTANAKDSTAEAAVWTDYVMDSAGFTPDVETACIFTSVITAGSGTTDGITTDTEYTTGADNLTTSTFVVSGIPNDINVAVTYDSSAYKVTWNVTDWDGSTSSTYEYVSKGGTAEYEVSQTDDAWYIITSNSTPTTVTTVTKADTKITLAGVNDTTEVDLTITKYDYMLNVTGLTSLTDTPSIAVGPYYLNKGETKNITGSDFSEDKRFAFTKVNSSTPETLAVELTPELLAVTAPDSGAKTIVALVEMDPYDHKVVVKDASSTLSTQYIDGNSTSYTFDSGVYVKSFTTSGTATVTLANPTLTTAASLSFAEISSDVTVTATTAKYDHILTLVDASNNPLGDLQYVSGTLHTYTIANNDLHYIVDAKVVSDSTVGSATLGNVGGKSMSISGISGNPTVQLTLQDYKYTVVWKDKAGNTLQTDYILENQTETSYTCDAQYVAQLASVAATGSQHTVTTADNKTYKVANISSNMTVVLDLIAYDNAVTIDDGTVKSTWYVKDDEDVLNGGGIFYQVDTKKYISDYTLTGTATVDGSTNTNTAVTDGWEYVDVTGIKSDVVLTLTVKSYDYKVTWNVTTITGDEEITTKKVHYVTGTTDSFDVGAAYSIASKKTTNGTITNGGSIVTVSDLTGNATVTVEARDYLYEVTWIYTQADENHEDVVVYQQADVEADGTVKWTVPESEDGKIYVVTGANVTGGTATHTNKTITVTPVDDKVTVRIDLAEALTNYTALWGDMSYKYYKNGAFYSRVEDGETYKWKLMDSYAWTPKAGSMITYYEGEPYVVPNGSVMLVNPTNQTVKATITVEMTYTESDWVVVPTMTLTPEKGVAVTTVNGKAVMEITLSPGESMIVTGTMEGTPLDATTLENVEGGSWSVEIVPID